MLGEQRRAVGSAIGLAGKVRMAALQPPNAELVETFLSQPDRYTYSGLKFSDCFSLKAVELVFEHGTTFHNSAVRQALMACNALPPVDPQSATPVRHITFEKHLDNLLRHILRIIADDNSVGSSDRVIAKLLLRRGGVRKRAPRRPANNRSRG